MNVAPSTYISLFSGVGMLDTSIRIAMPESRCICYVEREIGACAILAARLEDASLDDAPQLLEASA